MQVDFIIVGQGIGGSLMANELLKENKTMVVISDTQRPSSSEVAGGMFNPITGKQLTKTWLADTLFPFMFDYYADLEKLLAQKLIYRHDIYRPFVNENQKKQFLTLFHKHELSTYLREILPNQAYEKYISNPLGGLQTSSSGWLDVPTLLASFRSYLIQQNSFLAEPFDYNQLQISNEQIIYKNLTAKQLIFCEGFYVKENPYFDWLPMNPVKGETLIVEMRDYAIEEIVNQGKWILPMGNATYRFGATYSWHELDFENTEKAKQELIEKITQFLKVPFEIRDQKAGVRPATKDRRPIAGSHPIHKNVFVLNGLGTKGVTIAPYFANQLKDFILFGKEIHPETTIERFYSLY